MISVISVLFIVSACSACGQKGPPLPPLVLIPAPPEIHAERRGAAVEVGFTVPSANADGSRPANIARIDIFAVTGPAAGMTDLELLKAGTRVASLPVKSPRNPNETVEAGESTEVLEPPEGKGLDQGAASSVVEPIVAAILKVDRPGTPDRPLLGPSDAAAMRTYIGVGVDKRGRLGKFSPRVTVPLALAPPPPSRPTITYTETSIAVRWSTRSSGTAETPPQPAVPASGLLPSRPLGSASGEIAYNIYDSMSGARLTPKPITAREFGDARIAWGETRCYAVRAVQVVGASSLESDASEAACEKLVDTFPPAAPSGLRAVATEGAINLIWESNAETDLAGYDVLRAELPDGTLTRLTPMPIPDASFLDSVRPGARFAYVVVAVDRAGNTSMPSNRVEETAR